MPRQFEFKQFGAKYYSVPVCFWDDPIPNPTVPVVEPINDTEARIIENFENELKAVGFMKVNECLVKSAEPGLKFRVGRLGGVMGRTHTVLR